MRLTKTLKQAFVKRVMNDVPQEDYIELIRDIFVKGAIEALPEPVKKLYKSEYSEYIKLTYFSGYLIEPDYREIITISLPGLQKDYPARYDQSLQDYAPKSCKNEIKILVDKHLEQRKKLNALKVKLEGITESATTVANLKKLLPEFGKYLPSDSETIDRSVPAITNLVSDFTAAGWPKSVSTIPANHTT